MKKSHFQIDCETQSGPEEVCPVSWIDMRTF